MHDDGLPHGARHTGMRTSPRSETRIARTFPARIAFNTVAVFTPSGAASSLARHARSNVLVVLIGSGA
jgi:hypothetical protein